MIPHTIPTWQVKNWQQELSDLITRPRDLFSLLELDDSLLGAAEKAQALFPLRTTRAYASRIAKNSPDDPLLRQILPLNEEFESSPGFNEDPLQETLASPAPGLIHKYKGRVLLIAASQCAINCRYCFRRHFDYQSNTPSRRQWQQSLRYIADDPSIHEVILSGGDPLVLANKQLAWLVGELAAIPHLRTLRVHSRVPIVAPSRIDEALVQILNGSRLQCVMVIHCNHAQEIDDEVAAGLSVLHREMTVLNQSVLLKGVNDEVASLTALSHKLFRCGVLPYYLHALDKVRGAGHFLVSQERAIDLHKGLTDSLSGYLVPRLVKEVPNAASKIRLA